MLICRNSLSGTVDAVNDAFFFDKPLGSKERRETARWIASRQGLPGAYGQLFAGFPVERTSGIRVFTGERFTSASARHILGEESCRALLLLKSKGANAIAALDAATGWMVERVALAASQAPHRNTAGTFCCGKCTVGLWRHILAGGLDRHDQRLKAGLTTLRASRNGSGAWRTFPFWYTVLALAEMELADARKELQYAAGRIEAEAARSPGPTIYGKRRNAVAKRALERV